MSCVLENMNIYWTLTLSIMFILTIFGIADKVGN